MKGKRNWEDLFNEASREVEGWRDKHKKASLTEIENRVDEELARLRTQMIEDLAQESEVTELREVPRKKRPHCPRCGGSISANGKESRQLVTDHEQVIHLRRSKGKCTQCGYSFFPPG